MQAKPLQYHDIKGILDTSDACIIIHSMEGEIIDASEPAALELGYSREEIKQIFLANIKPKTLRLSDVCKIYKEESAPVIFQRRNGKRFPAIISTQVFRAQLDRINTNIVKLEFTIVNPAGEHTTLSPEFDAQESSEFLQLLSQEFRNPTQHILLDIDKLCKTPLNEEQRKLVDSIKQSSLQLKRMSTQISDSFKLGMVRQLNPQPFNLIDLLDDLLDTQLPKLLEQNLNLSLSIAPGLTELVFGDLQRLQQLFDSLLHIAVSYSNNSQLTLRTCAPIHTKTRDRIRFELSFAGNHLNPDDIKNNKTLIDDPRFKMDEAIARKLIQLMGGTLTFANSSPNHNSFSFEIHLPEVHNLDLGGNTRCLAEKRILLLEHNTSLLSCQLQYWGARVDRFTTASDAVNFLNTLQNNTIDIILIHHNLHAKPINLPAELSCYIDKSLLVVIKSSSETIYSQSAIEFSAPYHLGQLGNELARLVKNKRPYPYTHNSRRRLLKDDQVHLNLLLVDDSLTSRNIVIAFLENSDYIVDIAYNGIDAVLACADKRYNVILMDVQMPHMDGIEATTHIRKNSEVNCNTPIIAITGNTSNNTRVALESVSIKHILPKPVDKQALMAALSAAVHEDTPATTERKQANNNSVDNNIEPQRRSHERPENNSPTTVCEETLKRLISDTSVTACVEMIDIYLLETEQSLSIIVDCLEKRSLKKVLQEAHAIKSASGTFGCKTLHELAKQLEDKASDNNLNDCRYLTKNLPAVFASSRNQLKRFQKDAKALSGESL